MRVATALIVVCVAAALAAPAQAARPYAKKDCAGCHKAKTPGVVAPWKSSKHAGAKVGCADCHGKDYDANHPKQGDRETVKARVCAGCHKKAAKAHAASRHGRSFRAGRACTRNMPRSSELDGRCVDCHAADTAKPSAPVECARFLPRSDAMKRQGCLSCHTIENRCDRCHSPHDTDLAIARAPAICGTCHMGPDHAQYEMWESSRHGVLFAIKGEKVSPSCVGCHMPGGEHQVSLGIANRGHATEDKQHTRERALMLDRCERCHTRRFAADNLADGDAIERETRALLDEAKTIIRGLDAKGLLLPAPKDRKAHPLSGKKLVLGAQMLYENLSRVEAIYFRMAKFHYASAVKGAVHQNADYAHWYGNAPLELGLSEIRSEALLLDELWRLRQRVKLGGGGAPRSQAAERSSQLELDLAKLRLRHLDGELDAAAYKAAKRVLLDEAGL